MNGKVVSFARPIAGAWLFLSLLVLTNPSFARHEPEHASGSIVLFKGDAASVRARKEKRSIEYFSRRLKITHRKFQEALTSLDNKARIRHSYILLLNAIAVDVPPEKLSKLRNLPYVEDIVPDRKVRICLRDSVPWIGARDVWDDLGVRGDGTTIAIIDTGIDYTHPDLGGGFGPGHKVKAGYDFVNNDPDPMDDHGHGTHCAGIVAGTGVLSGGSFAGVAPCAQLLAYKVLDSEGTGTYSSVIAAIEAACDPNGDLDTTDHADVISMSLGGIGNPDDPLCTAVDHAVELGAVVVVAAGNGMQKTASIASPGCARKALTVGATDKSDFLAEFTSCGPVPLTWDIKPNLCAPGVGIISTRAAGTDMYGEGEHVLNNYYYMASGTSMATPHVAGVAALLRQIHPDTSLCSAEDICSLMMGTAIDLDLDLFEQGAGRVCASQAARCHTVVAPAVIGADVVNRRESPHRVIRHAITIKNISQVQESYHICTEMQPAAGISVVAKPSTVNVAPRGTATFDLEISVDNTTAPAGNYHGKVLITSGTDSVHAHFELMLYDGGVSQQGWPKRTEGQIEQSPILADVDRDGVTEIVFGHHMYDGGGAVLWVVKPDGTPLPGWPQRTGSVWFLNTPSVGDCDGDGKAEIVWSAPGRIRVYEATGNSQPENADFAVWNDVDSDASPSLGDIDSDGILDIVHVSDRAQAWKGNGDMLPNWPVMLEGPMPVNYGPPALADINCDGKTDIVCLTSDITAWNHLNVWDCKASPLAGFPQDNIGASLGCGNRNCVALGNLDSDSELELVSVVYQPGVQEFMKVIALNPNGMPLRGWPIVIEVHRTPGALCEPVPTAPALADVDADGSLEVVAAFGTRPGESAVYVWKSSGTTLPGFPVVIDAPMVFGSPTVADLDHDGLLDICIGDFKGRLWAFNCRGQTVSGFPIYLQPVGAEINTTPAIGDIDNDGKLEVVVASQGYDVSIYCFELNAAPNPSPSDWPMWHHDCRLTGLQKNDPYETVPACAIGTLSEARDGSWIRLEDVVVTRTFADLGVFYVQADDRSSGIRVESVNLPTPGDRVSVTGVLHTGTSERFVKAVHIFTKCSGNTIPNPLGTANKFVGGGSRGTARGTSSPALYNVGLLLKSWGTVTEVCGNLLRISDQGADFDPGLLVYCVGFAPPCKKGDYVSVIGVSSLHGNESCLLVAEPHDIRVLSE